MLSWVEQEKKFYSLGAWTASLVVQLLTYCITLAPSSQWTRAENMNMRKMWCVYILFDGEQEIATTV